MVLYIFFLLIIIIIINIMALFCSIKIGVYCIYPYINTAGQKWNNHSIISNIESFVIHRIFIFVAEQFVSDALAFVHCTCGFQLNFFSSLTPTWLPQLY